MSLSRSRRAATSSSKSAATTTARSTSSSGINNNGRIAGYFGSGAQHHPNKGYLINAPYAQGDIKSENFPHSVQTQVTGLNNGGVQVGFYSTQNNASGRQQQLRLVLQRVIPRGRVPDQQ